MKKYNCEVCKFFSTRKFDYFRHLKTKKHRKNEIDYGLDNEKNTEKEKVTTNDHKVTTNDHKMTTNDHKMTTNYFCEQCNKKFSSNPHLKRHQKMYCKSKQIINFEQNKKIENQNISMNNCYNTTINKNLILNINNYGNENLDMLNDSNLKYNILKMPFTAIPKLIENMHFNDKYPENKNIRMLNKKDNKLQIREDNDWKYVDKENTLRDLIEDKNNQMDGIYQSNISKLCDRYKERFTKFQDKFDTEDKELWKDILRDTELVFWNHM